MYKQEERKTLLFSSGCSRGAVRVKTGAGSSHGHVLLVVLYSKLSGFKAPADGTNSVVFVRDSL